MLWRRQSTGDYGYKNSRVRLTTIRRTLVLTDTSRTWTWWVRRLSWRVWRVLLTLTDEWSDWSLPIRSVMKDGLVCVLVRVESLTTAVTIEMLEQIRPGITSNILNARIQPTMTWKGSALTIGKAVERINGVKARRHLSNICTWWWSHLQKMTTRILQLGNFSRSNVIEWRTAAHEFLSSIRKLMIRLIFDRRPSSHHF